MLAVNFYVILYTFLEESESINYTFRSYLQIFGSGSKLLHLNQQSEKDWTFRFFKNKCLLNNDRLDIQIF